MFTAQICILKRKPMFSKKDYLLLDRKWKNIPVAFKAHPDTKQTIQQIQATQGFRTEAETLDFLLQFFLHTIQQTETQETQPTATAKDVEVFHIVENRLKTEISNLQTEIEKLEKRYAADVAHIVNEKDNAFDDGFEAAFNTHNIDKLTANLNEWFPKYFAPVIDGKPLKEVTPQQAVNLAVQYALEDAKEGFPYDHHSRPLLDELLIETTNEQTNSFF